MILLYHRRLQGEGRPQGGGRGGPGESIVSIHTIYRMDRYYNKKLSCTVWIHTLQSMNPYCIKKVILYNMDSYRRRYGLIPKKCDGSV